MRKVSFVYIDSTVSLNSD